MDTIDPAAGVAELLEHDPAADGDGTEAEQRVPPVVVVMVTNDPGSWFEDSLRSLGAQDYPSLSVLVLDNGSAEDPTARIADALPGAFVRRCPASGGFAAAANDALTTVEGAFFLLFCHDDVVFDPDAIRLMVEEAYRSNAGVVGPKVVARGRPDVLLEVGMSVDHYGVPFSGIERGEVDQGQHDGVRDVFYVSHAAMLVRADLFHELGGFDPQTAPGADDVDLCWRARLAGARVVVAPDARVGHGRATLARARVRTRPGPDDVRASTRARIRLLCKAYSGLALVWVLPVAFVLNVAEAFAMLLLGRPGRARALVAGWFGAFARPGELRRARAGAQRLRCVDDGDVRDLMIRGSARVRRFMIERVHAADRLADVSTRTRARVDDAARSLRRVPAILAAALALLVVLSVRSLLSGHVPRVGSFQAWPGVGAAWSTFTAGWRTTMMGAARPATPAFAWIAALSAALFDHPGLAQSIVVGGAIPLGALGAYRLLRPFTSSVLPGVAAAAAYAANPIARNAVWRGELGPLVCFALAPFVLSAVVHLTGDAGTPRLTSRRRVHLLCSLVLLGAIAGSVWPPAILFAPLVGVAVLLSAPFVEGARTAVAALVATLTAAAVTILVLAPWSFSLLGADAASLGARSRPALSFASVLSFHTGRAGAGIAPLGIVAAAVVPLAIATGPRLAWATRAWVLAVASFAVAWLPGRLNADAMSLPAEGVLVGAAIGLAFAAGLGVAAVLDDLRRFHFGWRQVMMVVAGLGLAFAVVGFAADSISGRMGLHTDDWASAYSWMGDNAAAGGFRVLWVGDPAVLPADARTAGDVGYVLTRDGVLDARAQWAAPEQRADRVFAGMIRTASAGGTVRLGHLLAPAGVRYVVFVQRATATSGVRGRDESRFQDALGKQLDLSVSNIDEASVVYTNDAWIPMHAVVTPGAPAQHVDERDPVMAATRSEPSGVAGVAAPAGRTAAVGPGTFVLSEAADSRWSARAGGRRLERTDAYGWTNAFALDAHAPVHVRYSGLAVVTVVRDVAVLLWLVLAVAWFATRRRVARGSDDAQLEITVSEPADELRVETPVNA